MMGAYFKLYLLFINFQELVLDNSPIKPSTCLVCLVCTLVNLNRQIFMPNSLYLIKGMEQSSQCYRSQLDRA